MSGDGTSTLRRVLGTPLPAPFSVRGALRRWRAARRWRDVVAGSGLPQAAAAAVTAVVERTRLWGSEKSDVARELCAHFREGLEAGRGVDELVGGFGEPRRAAALIGRAKKRQRGWMWQVCRRASQAACIALLLCIAGYVALALRFFAGTPEVKRDFLAELNAPSLAVPEAERAWPVYRGAILALERLPESLTSADPGPAWPRIPPGDPRWPEMTAYVARNREALDLVRRAAAMPKLGYVASYREDTLLLAAITPGYKPAAPPSREPGLVGVTLPYIGQFAQLARHLTMDLSVALDAGDPDGVYADLAALVGLAEHTRELPILIGDLTSWAILDLAGSLTGDVLATRPDLLTRDQLVSLSHRIAAFTGGRIAPRFSGERMMFLDALQRTYTDDGSGDGRMTPTGLIYMSSLSSGVRLDDALTEATAPVASAVMAGRREMRETYDRIIAKLDARASIPPWEWDALSPDAEVAELGSREGIGRIRAYPLLVLVPALASAVNTAEATTQRRDATLAAIALELYRRERGRYPGSLADLAPQLLPAVPPDRFDGRPLRYVLAGERPVLYSVGLDRDDDGGRPARNPDGSIETMGIRRWLPREAAENVGRQPAHGRWQSIPDGDWVLWPRPRE